MTSHNPASYFIFDNTSTFIDICEEVSFLPDIFARVLNSIGYLRVGDKLYVPRFAPVMLTDDRRYIPRPESIILSTLRRTVVAMSDRGTPQEFRRLFSDNCPIPGVVWRGTALDPLIRNADEIMPANYDMVQFITDINAIRDRINFLSTQCPRIFALSADQKPHISETQGLRRSMLNSNHQSGMRASPRLGDLAAYHRQADIEGDIRHYTSLSELSPVEQLYANIALLGERPLFVQGMYPLFDPRDPRAHGWRSDTSFATAYGDVYSE